MMIHDEVAHAELRVFLEYMIRSRLAMTDVPAYTLDAVDTLYGLMGENESIRAYITVNGDVGFCITGLGDNIDLSSAMGDTLTRLYDGGCDDETIASIMTLQKVKTEDDLENPDAYMVGHWMILPAPIEKCLDTGIALYPYADWTAFANKMLMRRPNVELNTVMAVLDFLRHQMSPYDYWGLIESTFAAANMVDVFVDGDDLIPDLIFFTTLE